MLPADLPLDYQEPLRPQFHFTAKTGWLNDPNGLVFANGEYHLFFQHNPFGTAWGNMTWGHAVSKDLVRWRQIENALEPDLLGTMFSGSAIVDPRNTSGLGKGMVLIYTAAGGTNEASKGKPFSQCIAFSPDGRKFTKYAGNPVLPNIEHENRDPKVFWHAPSKKWVMVLYLDGDRYALFGSPNLREWTKLCDVSMPGSGECPDFFEAPVVGERGRKEWVFWSANGRYRLGRFDGTKFEPTTGSIATNFGNTGYAAQTYYNEPKGRRVQIAWMNNANFPGCAWNQQMAFPTSITLRRTAQGPRLAFEPIDEIKRLRSHKIERVGAVFAAASGLVDFSGTWTAPTSGRLTIRVNGVKVSIDAATGEISALGKTAQVPAGTSIDLRILADRSSIEIFAGHGLLSMPLFFLAKPSEYGVTIEEESGWKGSIEAWELKSAWN